MRIDKGAGFTLIEVILVVLILSVIAGLTIPRFSSTYNRFILQKSVEDLAYIMRYAQSRAITKNRVIRLEFDSTLSQYWLTQAEPHQIKEDPMDQFERFSGRLGKTFRVAEGINLEMQGSHIGFHPDGTIDKEHILACQESRCLTISTKVQRGHINILNSKSDEQI